MLFDLILGGYSQLGNLSDLWQPKIVFLVTRGVKAISKTLKVSKMANSQSDHSLVAPDDRDNEKSGL